MKLFLIAAAAVAGVLAAPAATAHAEVSAGCWAHLSEIPAGETPAGDVRYHRARGELSPCTEREAAEAQSGSERRDGRREREGRFCDGRWWC